MTSARRQLSIVAVAVPGEQPRIDVAELTHHERAPFDRRQAEEGIRLRLDKPRAVYDPLALMSDPRVTAPAVSRRP